MTGVETTDHTKRYIREVFDKAIDGLIFLWAFILYWYVSMYLDVKSRRTMSALDNVYEVR